MFFKIEKLDFTPGKVHAMRCDNELEAQLFLSYLESQQREPWSDDIKIIGERLAYFDFSNETCYITFTNAVVITLTNSDLVKTLAVEIFNFKDYDWIVDDMINGQHAIKILESQKMYPDFNMTLEEILLGGKEYE